MPIGKPFPFFTDSPEQREEVVDFLENIVPSGYYVGIMTIQNDTSTSYYPEDWQSDSLIYGRSIFNVLENQGASLVRQLENIVHPYTIFYKKNDPNWPVQETIGVRQMDF
ncbi:MAG: hypothetical protein R2784_09905 [Saprospiraceae bacterium]